MPLSLIDAKLFKFLLAGIANAIVKVGALFVLFNGFGASYWVSSAGNYVACGTCSFFLNTLFVFKNRQKSAAPIFLFAAHRAVCYAEAYGSAQKIVFRILSERMEQFRGNALLFEGMVLYTVLNRVGERKSVFKNPPPENKGLKSATEIYRKASPCLYVFACSRDSHFRSLRYRKTRKRARLILTRVFCTNSLINVCAHAHKTIIFPILKNRSMMIFKERLQ